MMVSVGLDSELYNCRPFQLSGGQCQRVQIGRSLITRPELLVCDEPVSSLDVSVQAQIINLLEKMREEYGLTMLFISHDLAVVKAVCDRVAVMYLGKLCEIAGSDTLYKNPRHPYSALLLSSVPRTDLNELADTRVSSASREISSPASPLSGCRFHPRCARCQPICTTDEPALKNLSDESWAACHFAIG